MIILNSGRKLEIVLTGAVSANQPEVIVSYTDKRYDGSANGQGMQLSSTNNTTDVEICAAPLSGVVRVIDMINVYNKDTASVTVIIKVDEAGTEKIFVRRTLLTLETLTYEDE